MSGDDLFAGAARRDSTAPLADRMRPRSLDEFVGQDHIVGPGRLLRRAIQRDRLSSIILSGPPGTGKTTLARVIANSTASRFLAINAVLSGVQAIRDAVESATRERELYSRRTILFVDEVHRWNKAQQDALLPYVENGTIILIGATTENPFFEVNKALVSRSRVFQLHKLTDDDLSKAALAAVADAERGYGKWKLSFDDGALEHIVKMSDGDARSLLNALELAVETSVAVWPPAAGTAIHVSMESAEESIQKRAVLYDQDGDYHYDAASALIKSVRGSDPDAALYWAARMVYAGEDPRFIFRRLLISAAEDVGLADPQAIGMVQACASAFDRIGMPEGQYHLAEAVLYLATAPKSNSALSYFDALAMVESERSEVPDHLKDANRDADGLGHGKGYAYPHAYRDHWVAQQYLPQSLRGAVFYQPGVLGYEARIRDEVTRKRDSQLAAWLSGVAAGAHPGQTDVVPAKKNSDSWMDRATASEADGLAGLRDELFKLAFPVRQANVLVLAADDGLLVREAVRTCPEGSVTALCRSEEALERLTWLFRDTEELQRPVLKHCPDARRFAEYAIEAAGHDSFDMIMAAGLLSATVPDQEDASAASDREQPDGWSRRAVLEGLSDCATRFGHAGRDNGTAAIRAPSGPSGTAVGASGAVGIVDATTGGSVDGAAADQAGGDGKSPGLSMRTGTARADGGAKGTADGAAGSAMVFRGAVEAAGGAEEGTGNAAGLDGGRMRMPAAAGPIFALAERVPVAGVLPAAAAPHLDTEAAELFRKADAEFYGSARAPGFTPERLDTVLAAAGIRVYTSKEYSYGWMRSAGGKEADAWTRATSPYGSTIATVMGQTGPQLVCSALGKAFEGGPLRWPAVWHLCLAKPAAPGTS